MLNMKANIEQKYYAYPLAVRKRLLVIRDLIYATAGERGLGEVEESLKWGQPSYWVKGASPIRLDSYDDSNHQYALYFHCQTTLVKTFKKLYRDSLHFESNRALVMNVDDDLPVMQVKQCIALALRYHKVKHLPLLGMSK